MKVVLVVVDSLRADAPGFASGSARTPLLDALAAAGTTYDDCFASGSWTIPSLVSLLTGRFAHHLGVARWRHPFPARQPTLLTAFAAAGFEIETLHPYPRWGLGNVPGHGAVGDSQDPATVERALRGRRGTDRLILLHHWWTHLPYVSRELPLHTWHRACDFAIESLGRHPERVARSLEHAYHAGVGFFSEELLARYLDAAGAGGDDVLLVLTGDHGETWGGSLPAGRRVETVYDLHGRWLTDETIRVPLLFHGRAARGAIPGGRRLGGLVRGVDVGPTIADLAGIPWPGPRPEPSPPFTVDRAPMDHETEGASLAASLLAGAPAPSAAALTVSSHNTHEPRTYPPEGPRLWRALGLRTPGHWFVWDGVARRLEARSIAGGEAPPPAETERIQRMLESERAAGVAAGPLIPEALFPPIRREDPSQAAVEERLRALGYVD